MEIFEDKLGNVSHEEINRSAVCHDLHEVLPLIDEHNRMRESMIGLEKKWLTKDCGFSLLTTVSGLSLQLILTGSTETRSAKQLKWKKHKEETMKCKNLK